MTRPILHFALASLAAAALAAAAPMGTIAYLDAAYGFRDVRFDTPFASFHGLQPVAGSRSIGACFVRADEDLRLGDGEAEEIRYCFVNERLAAIEIRTQGRGDGAALREVLETAYGPGRPSASPGQWIWRGHYAAASLRESREPSRSLARLWRVDEPGRPPAGRPPHEPAYEEPAPLPQGAARLQIDAVRQVRAGQATTVTIKYREVQPPARVRLVLSPELALQSSQPSARVDGDELIWDGLTAASGSLKLKLFVRPEAVSGDVPVLHGDLVDATGGRSEASAQLRVR